MRNFTEVLVIVLFALITVDAQRCEVKTEKALVPRFPAAAIALNETGKVKVRVSVDPTGHVSNAVVVSGPKILGHLSMSVAKDWQFSVVATRFYSICGERSLVLLFNYLLLPSETPSDNQSLSYFIYPNRIEVREKKLELSLTPSGSGLSIKKKDSGSARP